MGLSFWVSLIAALIAFGVMLRRAMKKAKKEFYGYLGDYIFPCCGVGIVVFVIFYFVIFRLN